MPTIQAANTTLTWEEYTTQFTSLGAGYPAASPGPRQGRISCDRPSDFSASIAPD